jgi:hypothetical protein
MRVDKGGGGNDLAGIGRRDTGRGGCQQSKFLLSHLLILPSPLLNGKGAKSYPIQRGRIKCTILMTKSPSKSHAKTNDLIGENFA